MDEQEKIHHYIHLFGELFSRLGRWVRVVLLLLIAILIVFQAALHIRSLRPYVSPMDKLDGVPVKERSVKDWNEENH